jgi:hypothetical protein
VVAWGSNSFGQITVPPNLTNVVMVAAGVNHSLALKADGTVVGWGDNQFGQSTVPSGLSEVVSIAAGQYHSLALQSNGKVIAWGTNDQRTMVPAAASGVVFIAASWSASYVIRSDGTGIAWPNNTQPWFITNIVALSSGEPVIALSADGSSAFPGGGPTTLSRATEIATVTGALQGYAGGIRSDGAVITLGPFNQPLGLKATGLACANYHFAAIKGDSTVVVWKGVDIYDGFPGPADPVLTTTPPRLRGVFSIVGGGSHFLALKLPTPPIPSIAKASAQIVNGFVVGLNILDGGEGYATPPQVTITGGGGSGATATAQISKGIVTGFTITNAGIGYTSAPTVTIESPPFLPKLSIATSRVGVTMQVVPGKRYELESSNDLPNFGPVGAPFVANKDTISQEFIVSETGQFFRIVEVP